MASFHDLHLHVLPGLDDGARDMNAAIEILQGLTAVGFTRVVATPHVDDRRYTYGKARIDAVRDEVDAALAENDVQIGLDTGGEYAYGSRFHSDLQDRRLITLAGSRYVLLELPEQFIPASMPSILFSVGAAGYYTVLAHPERCRPFQKDTAALELLAGGRAMVQVSFRSLAGTFGRTVKRAAWTLVGDGIADLVATDCHHPRELAKIVRPVLAELRSRLPPKHLDRLLTRTPARMLDLDPG